MNHWSEQWKSINWSVRHNKIYENKNRMGRKNPSKKNKMIFILWPSQFQLHGVCFIRSWLLAWVLFDNGIKEISHALFREKNERKWWRGWWNRVNIIAQEEQQTKTKYTRNFFFFFWSSKNGQKAINQALCYLIHR